MATYSATGVISKIRRVTEKSSVVHFVETFETPSGSQTRELFFFIANDLVGEAQAVLGQEVTVTGRFAATLNNGLPVVSAFINQILSSKSSFEAF